MPHEHSWRLLTREVVLHAGKGQRSCSSYQWYINKLSVVGIGMTVVLTWSSFFSLVVCSCGLHVWPSLWSWRCTVTSRASCRHLATWTDPICTMSFTQTHTLVAGVGVLSGYFLLPKKSHKRLETDLWWKTHTLRGFCISCTAGSLDVCKVRLLVLDHQFNVEMVSVFCHCETAVFPMPQVPWCHLRCRVLHAELPQYLGKSQESLDLLYYVHAIVTKVCSYLLDCWFGAFVSLKSFALYLW